MTKLCELKLFKRSQFTKIYHLKKAPPVKLNKKILLPSVEMKFIRKSLFIPSKNRLFKSDLLNIFSSHNFVIRLVLFSISMHKYSFVK